MQLLESPIPPLTAAALWLIICKRPAPFGWPFSRGMSLQIIICKRPAPPNDHLQEPVPPDHHLQEAGPSFWQRQKGHEKCIIETLQWKKMIKMFTFAYGQGRRLHIYHPSIIVSSVITLRGNRRLLHCEKIFVPSEWCWHLTRNLSPACLTPGPCFISVLRLSGNIISFDIWFPIYLSLHHFISIHVPSWKMRFLTTYFPRYCPPSNEYMNNKK